MHRYRLLLTLFFVSLILASKGQQPFTAGNIVVYRVGDGANTLVGNKTTQVFIDEYSPSGTLVQSIAMPTTGNALTEVSSYSQDGNISLSTNGNYLVVGGYRAPLGVAGPVTGSLETIGIVDYNGVVNTSTSFANNGSSIQSVAADGKNNLWFGRFDGMGYTTVGAATSAQISSDPTQSIDIANGQLYSSSNNSYIIEAVGTGLPTTSGQVLHDVPGFLPLYGFNQFTFLDLNPNIPGPDVFYAAMQYGGGIIKYSLVNGTWVQNGIVGLESDAYLGLTAKLTGTTVSLFATRQGANNLGGGELVSLTDASGYNGTFIGTPSVIATAPLNKAEFRGVALVPQPLPFTSGDVVVYRVGDGVNTMTTNRTVRVFLDEYGPTGTLVQSIGMPSNGSALTDVSSYNVDGLLSLSANGKYIVLGGYGAPVGVSGPVTGSLETIGTVDYNGVVNTSTTVANNGSSIQSTASDGNGNLYFGRFDGIGYTTVGATASTQISSDPTQSIDIDNGQLYSSSNNSYIIEAVGAGLPTTSGQVLHDVPGFLPLYGFNQFTFLDLNPNVPGVDVFYAAMQYGGGIIKYSLVNGTWVQNGIVGLESDAYVGLTAKVNGTAVTLFATCKGNNFGGGELVSLTDASGYNGNFSGTPAVIASVAISNTMAFRGVALAPQQPPSCGQPNGLFVNPSPTSAFLQWNPISGVAGYQYAVDMNSTPPASGTETTQDTATVTGLTNGTTYYLHVRTDCGNFNYSDWTTVSFTTGCQAPAVPTVTVSDITSAGTAQVAWSAVFGAASYQYAVTIDTAAPATYQVATDTTFQATGLNSVSQYYVHIRSDCGGGNYSPWETIGFNTACFLPALNVTVNTATATVTWNSLDNASGYEYALTTYQADPLSGTMTTDTTYQADKLINGAGYYFHVRSHCSGGAVSDWSTIAFTVQGLEAYPNPTKDVVTIRLNGISAPQGQLTMSDAIGRIVRSIAVGGNSSIDIDMSGMASGIYLVRYSDGTNKYTLKVMKL